MTEKEAIEQLYDIMVHFEQDISEAECGDKYAIEAKEDSENGLKALCVSVKALQEIQQYRAIGTVEECRAAVDSVRTGGILPDKPQCKEPKYMHDREELFGAADFYKKRFLEVK